MHEGKQRRMRRVFAADGRTLIVAMDHAAYMPDVVDGLQAPNEIIKQVLAVGADAVMTTLATIRTSVEVNAPHPLIMSVESSPEYAAEMVEQALCLGVDMIKSMVYPWSEQDPHSLSNFGRMATLAERWCLPVMAEVFPGGFSNDPVWKSVNKLSAGARVAAEAGADVIKTYYVEESRPYREVVRNCPVPVVVLGGDKSDDPRPLFEKIARALDSGAAGVAIGRNIWGHPHPAAMTTALAALIHQGVSVDEAIKILNA